MKRLARAFRISRNAKFAEPAVDCGGNRHGHRILLAAGLVSLLVVTGCGRRPAAKLSFNETIQPILSENCYGCHGPDSSSRKAGLRLDRAELAFAPHDEFGPAIVAFKPDQSPLVRRIEAKNAEERMPPPEAHKVLKPDQIALLRQWVAEGARYEPHWAFITPQRPPVPRNAPADRQWARNDIDRFIQERLSKEQLAPSPEADKRTLIRRVTYDLTGLPPAPEEIAAFLADAAPDAYEKVVDRLLASPRYGEHRAHYWLDYVRYADTHGLFADNYRAIWPYRDYVIKAFNENKYFDQFVREQLAGDLLPEQTLDALIATGFVRSNPTTFEGGTIPEEVFANLTRDRVETFGVTFLGLTTGCAVCHDHKFDPTTQRDTYQLAAFLNNTVEAPTDFGTPDPPPVIRLPDDKDRAAYEALIKQRGNLLASLEARRHALPALMKAHLAAGRGPLAVSTEKLELRLRFDENQGDAIRNTSPQATHALFKADTAPIIWGETEWLWPSARFETNTHLSLNDVGDVEADEGFSTGGWMAVRVMRFGVPSGAVIARVGDLKRAENSGGWEVSFQQYSNPFTIDNAEPSGRFFFNLAGDASPSSATRKETHEIYSDTRPPPFKPMRRAIQVRTRDEVPAGQWVHVFVTYDGSRKADGVRIYLNGQPVAMEVMNDSLGAQDSIRTDAPTQLGRRADNQGILRETSYQDLRLYRRALSSGEVARLPYEDVAAEVIARKSDPSTWTVNESFVVMNRYFLRQKDTQARDLQGELDAVQSQIDRLAPPRSRFDIDDPVVLVKLDKSAAEYLRRLVELRPTSLIAQEKATPAFAHVLKRGNYTARGERVGAETPHFLPRLPPDVTRNRLALANWLFTPEHPLFARVAVNRMWQELFSTGLVESSGDFGLAGSRPSHPQLLDWLAVEFRESGWDVKRMYRMLVLAATYRQSARVTPELLQIDPANRLLARGPRFRMDGEGIRDSVLTVSGLLVEKSGGPPVMPYQPPGLWREVGFPGSNTRDYPTGSGDDLYRRTVYSFWKRTSPPPSLETFDAPSRETACSRRSQSNTPLQALITWNDPQFVEAARLLAQRVLRAYPATQDRMDRLALITLGRPLGEHEKSILERTLQAFTKHFASQPQAAKALLTVGETRSDPSLDLRELATWTMVASVLLNLDEFIMK